VGGGGADVDWDVALGLGYKFNDTISAVAGYRALGVNYENDGFVFDVVQQGPIVGVAIHFQCPRQTICRTLTIISSGSRHAHSVKV
jgi:hypothetical protein